MGDGRRGGMGVVIIDGNTRENRMCCWLFVVWSNGRWGREEELRVENEVGIRDGSRNGEN